MGIARLLAKGWIAFCLFAGAHALRLSIEGGEGVGPALVDAVLPTLLFTAMGLLFIVGYGASAAHGAAMLARLKPRQFVPGFNELVFVAFALLSFVNQVFFAPSHVGGAIGDAMEAALGAIVPGQRALEEALSCGLDGGRIFASAFAWLLAIIYIASAISRLRLAAGIIRIERTTWAEPLGPLTVAIVLGTAAIVGVQFLFVGTIYRWMPCASFTDIGGALLIGLAPLMLAYLVVAALAAALATGPE
jgi:hypothetical protein